VYELHNISHTAHPHTHTHHRARFDLLQAYVTSTGHLVVSPRKIAITYTKTWLLLDIVATFPVDVFFGPMVNTTVLKIFKIPRALRVAKVLKFMRDAVAQRLIMWAFRVSRLLFLLLLVVHWIVCLFNVVLQDPDSTFMQNIILKTNFAETPAASAMRRMLDIDDLDSSSSSGNASQTPNNIVLSLGSRYTVLLYYSIIMILGNDTYPTTRAEFLFAGGFALGGAIMQAYVLGEISVLLTSINLKARAWQEKIDMVNESMAYMEIGE
jgi:hypothetical protein